MQKHRAWHLLASQCFQVADWSTTQSQRLPRRSSQPDDKARMEKVRTISEARATRCKHESGAVAGAMAKLRARSALIAVHLVSQYIAVHSRERSSLAALIARLSAWRRA
jgi:hypothetical protein